jgi:hypothetical protein
VFIIKPNSNPAQSSRQRLSALWKRFTAILLMVVGAAGLCGIGCQGIYHESGEIYPPDPCARLKLTIDRARQASKQTDNAAMKLRDRVAKGFSNRDLEADIDRLETSTLEFGRRVAAISDALADCEHTDQFTVEIQDLQRRSAQMLQTIQLIRHDGLSTALPLLDRMLKSPSQP